MRIILMLLLAFVSSNAMAQWVNLGENDVFTAYANSDTIRRSGDKVEMSTIVNYNAPVDVETGKPFMSIKVQNEYDCKKKQYRQLALVAFSESMGAGQSIHVDSTFREWSRVTPDTVEENFFDYACRKK